MTPMTSLSYAVQGDTLTVGVTPSMVSGLTITPVLVGQAITTHEMHGALNSVYRIAGSSTAGAPRPKVTPRSWTSSSAISGTSCAGRRRRARPRRRTPEARA